MRLNLLDDSYSTGSATSAFDDDDLPNAIVEPVRVGTAPALQRLLTQVERAGESGGAAGFLGRLFVLRDLEEEACRELEDWAESAKAGHRATIVAGIALDEDGGAHVAGMSAMEVQALADAISQIVSAWPGSYKLVPSRFDVELDVGDADVEDPDEELEDDEHEDDDDLVDDEDEDEDDVGTPNAEEADEREDELGAVVTILILKTSA